jgi:hypothetical protein
MNIEELKNNTLVSNIVKTILDNDNYYKNCEESMRKIYADNKIDSNDIPIILNLLVSTYNNYSTFSIDKKDIKEVLILIFIEMIERLEWTYNINLEETINLLSPQIDLLLITINTNTECIEKCKRFFCCASKNKTDPARP